MIESTYWAKIRKNLGRQGLWLRRVENVVSTGDPDIEVAIGGGFRPIELKYIDRYPKRDSTPVLGRRGLRPEQIAWWGKAQRFHVKGWFMIGVSKDTYLIEGRYFDHLNLMDGIGLRAAATLYYEDRIDWRELAWMLEQ
jgi:hypothetical protein